VHRKSGKNPVRAGKLKKRKESLEKLWKV